MSDPSSSDAPKPVPPASDPVTPDPGSAASEGKTEINGAEGIVKWFDPRKGFGFIFGPEGQDIFTHFSVIEGDGFRALKDGSTVIYDAVKQDNRWKATRVHKPAAPAVPEVIVPEKRSYTRSPRA